MSSLFTHEDKDAASNTFWKPGTAAPRPTHTRTGGKHEPSGAFQKASHRESVKAKEDTRLIAKQGLSATILDRHGEEEDGVFPVYNPRMKMPLEQQRQLLPIFRYRDTLLYALEHHLTVILVGETGSGKTTRRFGLGLAWFCCPVNLRHSLYLQKFLNTCMKLDGQTKDIRWRARNPDEWQPPLSQQE